MEYVDTLYSAETASKVKASDPAATPTDESICSNMLHHGAVMTDLV